MKVFSIRKEQILAALCILVLIVCVAYTWRQDSVTAFSMPVSKKIVLIDAGHGGADPGKVAGSTQEKNLNLAIAQKLQVYLEQGGSTVLMTRADDADLGASKKSDMYSRKLTASESRADIFVSIHQNSFTSSSAQGAQVFYFNKSDNSKRLAECIQAELESFVDQNNTRVAKANDNYYVLKQTAMPAVLVECGFLSNPAEKAKLGDDYYQEQIAWGIYMGIVKYFQEGK